MKSVLITGVSGGIGSALAKAFSRNGFFVIGTDIFPPQQSDYTFIKADLNSIATCDKALDKLYNDVKFHLAEHYLNILVNNAAYQYVRKLDEIDASEWQKSLNVNLTAPFRLAQRFTSDLKMTKGCILNIGSVHAIATKRGFSAYATSKAALHGFTRSLALEFGPDIRSMCLAPAAVSTQMLKDGFADNPELLNELERVHPAQRIATPEEIAEVAVGLTSSIFSFSTGTTLFMDGGILSALKDPI